MTPSIGRHCGYCGKRIDSISREQNADTTKQQTKHTENHKPPKGIIPAVIGIILGIFSLLVLTDGLFGLFDNNSATGKVKTDSDANENHTYLASDGHRYLKGIILNPNYSGEPDDASAYFDATLSEFVQRYHEWVLEDTDGYGGIGDFSKISDFEAIRASDTGLLNYMYEYTISRSPTLAESAMGLPFGLETVQAISVIPYPSNAPENSNIALFVWLIGDNDKTFLNEIKYKDISEYSSYTKHCYTRFAMQVKSLGITDYWFVTSMALDLIPKEENYLMCIVDGIGYEKEVTDAGIRISIRPLSESSVKSLGLEKEKMYTHTK